MKFLILLVVAVGVCSASPPGFLQNTPEVQAATIKFINEYNRLARLAAEAPDIHIYHQDPRHLQRIDHAPATRRATVAVRKAINPRHNVYAYTANLGTNHQFQPHQFQSPIPAFSRPRTRTAFVVAPTVVEHRQPYRGPFADTVPAGVHGIPTPVRYTPAVQAARDAHFRAVAQAHRAIGILG